MRLINLLLFIIPIAAVLGCGATDKDAEFSTPKRLDKTRPYVLTFKYPNFPRTVGMQLELWVYDFQKIEWRFFPFINKRPEKWIRFPEPGTLSVDFGTLGYGDGLYGILIQTKSQPPPKSPQMTRRILIDTVPPKIKARFLKDKPVYSAGETILIDTEILERQPKESSLMVEMRSRTTTEWKPVLTGLQPNIKTIKLAAPRASEKVNFLRISVQDEARNTGSVVIGPFTISSEK